MRFPPTPLSAGEERLREAVREFLRAELPPDHRPGLGMAAEHDPGFSKRLASRGWIGMAFPRRYGGHGRSAVERFIVTEELLAAGAPIWAHWIADRQTGPMLLSFGTESQKQRFLPAIAAGECFFSLGMSEPDAGSDLASVKSRAERVEGGWRLNGTKVWTSGAHRSHYFAVLCRTSPADGDRHAGLSQLIVDLRQDGVQISPIPFIDGTHEFNEVALTDVLVPDDMLLGQEGQGWKQVTSELVYERAGPDRYLSTLNVLTRFMASRWFDRDDPGCLTVVGRAAARYWTLRQMSLSVARAIDAGGASAVDAAMIKDLGTVFEQHLTEAIRSCLDQAADPGATDQFQFLLARAILTGPVFTIRGGTTEILRSVVARELLR
jgi:alkylation response protein AidB-like acyl-CoA dehydrogenase